MKDIAFDLQLFGEEGGGDNGGAQENIAPKAGEGEQAAPAGTAPLAGAQGGQEQGGSEQQKPGTILGGGKEETAAWDLKSVVPEGMAYDEATATAYASVAKELGLNGEQAQKMAAYGMKYAQEVAAAGQRAWAEQVQGWALSAKAELGASYDSTVQAAGTGLEAMEKIIPNLRKALDETGAGNRVELIQAFAMIGNLVGEDNFRGFGSAEVKSTRYPNTDFSKY